MMAKKKKRKRIEFSERRKLLKQGFKKLRVYFHDEAPTIGAGWRQVYAREGKKWAYLVGRARAGRVKVPLETWRAMVPN